MSIFKFPKDLYTDVRIEDVFETNVVYTMGNLDELKTRQYKAAFIRIFDGDRWYYGSTCDTDKIQAQIDFLAAYASPQGDIGDDPVVKKYQAHRGNHLRFQDKDISKVDTGKKVELLKSFFPILNSTSEVKMWKAQYIDKKVVKYFFSSQGAELTFDTQLAGIALSFSLADGDKKLSEKYQKATENFEDLRGKKAEFSSYVDECVDFLKTAKPIEPGEYTVILSPLAAGVFAHESFGHKSESDFMIGNDLMKREWAIGKKVGSEILSIVDDGNHIGSGYTPFDDEGSKAQKTFLISEGVLTGRLHSGVTAASLQEDLTGNARALNFEFEPIVRMTTTYILPGDKAKDQLFGEVKEGIFVDTVKHGSGMSTFTIAPNRSYLIKEGRIVQAVNVSVITGNVLETLAEIDGLSDELEILSFATGGCGKMEQYPLPVGFGGPYVRIKNMKVE